MNGTKAFFDTNVLIYAVTDQGRKTEIAKALVAHGGVISVQVLNEFAAVTSRKFGRSWAEISEVSGWFRQMGLGVAALDEETHDAALEISTNDGLHIYDACIVASAIQSGCGVLLTEDLQHGRRFGALVIRNPFAGANDG